MLPVVFPFPLPTGVSEDVLANGNIPLDQLVQVGDQGFLHKQVALAYNATAFAARVEAGLQLTYTYGGLYRSLATQLRSYLDRNEPVSYAVYLVTPASRRSKFNGKYYRRRKSATGVYYAGVAVPKTNINGIVYGTSNHGKGIAWDVALGDRPSQAVSLTDAAHGWLLPNVVRFGWSYESQEERWHIRWVLGDAFTADINRYVRTMLGRDLRLGDSGQDVARFQAKMGLAADGNFGEQTAERVKMFQGFFKQAPTGVINADLRWFLEA